MTNFIVTSSEPGKMGGSKAKEDIVDFFEQNNYSSFRVNPYHASKLAKLWYTHTYLMRFFKNKEIENVVIQYPIPSPYMINNFVNGVKKQDGAKLIFWIHDIQSLQRYQGQKKKKWEIDLFNMADVLVVHNEKMQTWLEENGVHAPMIVLGIFDYDNPVPIQENVPYEKTICFAGALFKSTFLSKLKMKHQLYTFGPDMPKEHSNNIIYSGQFTPEELPSHLTQNFGLIWDGPEIQTCAGTFGHYQLFNNPHKASLYISTGIPVIIWSKAALADFVLENKIGVVVDSLEELDDLLDNLSEEDYLVLKNNVVKLAEKLRSGYFTKNVIKQLAEI
ncbi:beta-1,6-galactofuranosyltransferase [Liquorilactobacillus mali]|uniref:beta-1,6-galactofuranosyltransferase n=1 Tax=Liquorilactobacillus mali TaxID=1618 RepID=UPI002350517B|nr:beta-1,6-galactofuranosyltransferase [Liquorilactobacillus mali]MDC7952262.1 sugar transferase [Liquorilactobacillus mali]MDV7757621.1 beta-1,6-galactofuranosyltransferase [Liquorilactobacillus mali]